MPPFSDFDSISRVATFNTSSVDDCDMVMLLATASASQPQQRNFHSSEPCLFTSTFDLEEGMGFCVDSTITNDSSPSHSHIPIKKSVQFEDYDDVFAVPNFSDVSPDQKDDMYMSSEQLDCVRREALSLIHQLDNMEENGTAQASFCTRGLVQHTRAARTATLVGRYQLYDIVSDVQQNYYNRCLDENQVAANVELLARCLMQSGVSERSAEQARARAIHDAEEVHSCTEAMMVGL
jgi:hypothetical protein